MHIKYTFTANTPSPADYNPLNSSNPTGAVIPRSSRFTDPKSPTDSHNTSVGSTSSLNKSCFRSVSIPIHIMLRFVSNDLDILGLSKFILE